MRSTDWLLGSNAKSDPTQRHLRSQTTPKYMSLGGFDPSLRRHVHHRLLLIPRLIGSPAPSHPSRNRKKSIVTGPKPDLKLSVALCFRASPFPVGSASNKERGIEKHAAACWRLRRGRVKCFATRCSQPVSTPRAVMAAVMALVFSRWLDRRLCLPAAHAHTRRTGRERTRKGGLLAYLAGWLAGGLPSRVLVIWSI
ncbi:uncharacterized protein J3D65DRAFT_220939 [Phyllosticta citribraziliensis]|uniref:Uncharacterized protein n=1 Tax=Phyllosticta citribraziliensis TaxID=989973 RepID=A0ABR1M6D1_9PEZI